MSRYFLGDKTTFNLPNNEKRNAQYAIVELSDIVASHNEKTFLPSRNYPIVDEKNINSAFCCDEKMESTVMLNAKGLDPERLLKRTFLPSGTIIIDKNGIVLSGNRRAMSLKLAASDYPKKHEAYKKELCENAPNFGFEIVYDSAMRVYVCANLDDGSSTEAFLNPTLIRFDYDFPMPYSPVEIAKYNGIAPKKEAETKAPPQYKKGKLEDLNFTINADALREALSMALPCVSTDELRPQMMGVCFEVTPEGTYLTATNAHVLSSFFTPSVKTVKDEHFTFIMPTAAVVKLKTELAKKAETVDFQYVGVKTVKDSNGYEKQETSLKAVVKGGASVEFVATDARYPDWRAVVPIDNPFKFKFNRLETIVATEAMLIVNKTTGRVDYDFKDKLTEVSAVDIAFDSEGKTYLKSETKDSGDAVVVYFNGRFVCQLLRSFDNKDFVWELSTATRAALIVPERPKDGNKAFILIMPINPRQTY